MWTVTATSMSFSKGTATKTTGSKWTGGRTASPAPSSRGSVITSSCASDTLLPMPDFSIGVDLGGTNLRIAAITSDGQLLEKVTLDTKVAFGPDHVVGEMCDAILRLSNQYRGGGAL